MWHSAKGYVIIEVKGRNAERFLNGLHRAGISAEQVTRKSADCIRMTLSVPSFRKLRLVAGQSGCRVHIVGRSGLPFLLRRIAMRPALWIGLLLSVCLLALMSTRIMVIRVFGCSRVPQSVVRRALEQEGINTCSPRPKENLIAVAERVRTYDARFKWIGLELDGFTLTVHVQEAEPIAVLTDIDTPCNVVAVKDGVVTEVQALAGKALVSAGDVVKAGDVLIAGEFYPDTKEAFEGTVLVHARGTVTAQAFYYASFVAEREELVFTDTGRTAPYRRVSLLDRTLTETRLPFDEYEVRDAATYPLTDCLLPYRVTVGTAYEQAERMQPTSIEQQRLMALFGAEQAAFLKVPQDARVTEKQVNLMEDDGVIMGVACVVTEESIGLTKEIEH